MKGAASYGSVDCLDTASSRPDGLGGFHARVYSYSFALGFGLLLPFNFVINLVPWLATLYDWPGFGFWASLALTNPTLAVQFILLPCGQHVPSGHRIRGSLCAGAAALVVLALVAPHTAPWVGLVVIASCGVAEAVMEASLMALFGRLPSGLYAQAYMAGVAAAGVASSALQLLLHLLLAAQGTGSSDGAAGNEAAAAYVAAGVAVLCACVGVHAHLARLPPIVKLTGGSDDCCGWGVGCASNRSAAQNTSGSRGARGGAAADEEATVLLSPLRVPDLVQPPPPNSISLHHSPGSDTEVQAGGVTYSSATSPQSACSRASVPLVSRPWAEKAVALRRVVWSVANPAAAVFHNFTATFFVYPGVLSVIPQRSKLWHADEQTWFSAILLLYALCDFAGRSAAGCHRPLPGRALLGYSLARYAIVPVLVGCARGWPGLASDAVTFAAVFVCGLTNGHVATLAMMHSTSQSSQAAPREARAIAAESESGGIESPGGVAYSADSRITDAFSSQAASELELAGFVLAASLKAGTVVGSDLAILLTLGSWG